MKELIKKYLGKEITVRVRGNQFTNALVSDIFDDMAVFATISASTKAAILHFIHIDDITSFSVGENLVDEEHLKYVEKLQLRQTFK